MKTDRKYSALNEDPRSGGRSEPDEVEYLLGMMTSAEEAVFEHDMKAKAISAESISTFQDGITVLTMLAEQVSGDTPAPRRSLKDKILRAVADEQLASETAHSKVLGLERQVIRKESGLWQESGMPGITLKLLHQIADTMAEPGHSRYSVLVRLAKGAEYPHHRHVGYEECLVLEGDIHVNDVHLKAGDFILTDDRTEHVRTWSDDGCLLLLSTMLEDEVLAR